MDTRRRRLWPGTSCGAALLSLAVFGSAFAADRSDGGPRARTILPLAVGDAAPDFELPLLKQEVNAEGEKVGRISDEKVRLSSLRGKKVVCLFMSSYT